MSNSFRKDLCAAAREAFRRGDAHGTTGSLSVRRGDTVWITPAGKPLHHVAPTDLACVGTHGEVRGGNRPSDELALHLAVYTARAEIAAVVHLHSPYSVSLSCLAELDEAEPLPPLTPGFQSRVAPLGVVSYIRPGTAQLTEAVGESIRRHNCLLLRNHGILCVSRTLQRAVERAVELEETARVYFIAQGRGLQPLTSEQAAEIDAALRGPRNADASA